LYGGVSGFLTILCKQWCAPGTETPPPTSLFPQACNQRITVVKFLLHVSDLCPKFCSMCFN
ncbi:hypothetical protein ACK1QH_004805, partial [Salmonella enterica]